MKLDIDRHFRRDNIKRFAMQCGLAGFVELGDEEWDGPRALLVHRQEPHVELIGDRALPIGQQSPIGGPRQW